jgi:hypothetical protein
MRLIQALVALKVVIAFFASSIGLAYATNNPGRLTSTALASAESVGFTQFGFAGDTPGLLRLFNDISAEIDAVELTRIEKLATPAGKIWLLCAARKNKVVVPMSLKSWLKNNGNTLVESWLSTHPVTKSVQSLDAELKVTPVCAPRT